MYQTGKLVPAFSCFSCHAACHACRMSDISTVLVAEITCDEDRVVAEALDADEASGL